MTLDLMATLLRVNRISCTVPLPDGGERTLFHDLSFNIDAGEVVDITGPSGSGKSSLLTAVARLNPHATAQMELSGKPAEQFSPQQWRAAVAYLPQRPTLTGNTVAEAIRLPWTLAIRSEPGNDGSMGNNGKSDSSNNNAANSGANNRQRRSKPHIWSGNEKHAASLLPDERIRTMLNDMGCEDIELDRHCQDLSGGQAARVALARTLLTEPQVMLADEVDAGLDDDNAAKVAEIMAQAAQRGMAIVRIRHRPPDGLATRIMTLDRGRLTIRAYADPPEGNAAETNAVAETHAVTRAQAYTASETHSITEMRNTTETHSIEETRNATGTHNAAEMRSDAGMHSAAKMHSDGTVAR